MHLKQEVYVQNITWDYVNSVFDYHQLERIWRVNALYMVSKDGNPKRQLSWRLDHHVMNSCSKELSGNDGKVYLPVSLKWLPGEDFDPVSTKTSFFVFR